MIEYTTEAGVELLIGRIPRQHIDRFIAQYPQPEPPMVEVETWAGDAEEVANYDAPEYKQAMLDYYTETGYAQIELIAEAIEVDTGSADFADLESLGIVTDKASFLRHILVQNPVDLEAVTEAVFYNSTVTPRGIMEAADLFGVTWRGKRVSPFVPDKTGAKANAVYGDQLAARWAGWRWEGFYSLPGVRQSEIVALYRLDSRLQILMSRVPVRGK